MSTLRRLAALSTATAALALASLPASAAVVFSSSFDAENGGNSALNYTGWSGWTVSNGSVDLVRSGNFGIGCRGGSGSCVDLDGSTGDAGRFTTGYFNFNAGDVVRGDWYLSGNQRNGSTEANLFQSVEFGAVTNLANLIVDLGAGGVQNIGNVSGATGVGWVPSIAAGSTFLHYGFEFTATAAGSVRIGFHQNGGDNVGPILDDVSLSVTPRSHDAPEPASWGLVLAALGGLAAARRRRG